MAHCRAGKGPYLLEMKTYRYRGHSMSDPGQVPHPRGGAEDAHASTTASSTPRARLAELGVDEAEIKTIDDEVKRVVQDAADFAQSQPRARSRRALDRRAGGGLSRWRPRS